MGYKERDREITTQSPGSNSQTESPNNTNKWVINLSSTPFTQVQESLLSKGPNYVVAPKTPPLEYITDIESAYQKLQHQEAEELRADVNRVLRSYHAPKSNLSKERKKP